MAEGGRKHDVFISYATPDKAVADKILAALEKAGIGCWIAWRDGTPGDEFTAGITRAISASRIFVLVYSDNTSDSSFVPRELERAVSRKLRVVTIKLTTAPLAERFELLLALSHWLDASAPPLEQHIRKLAATVQDALRTQVAPPGTKPGDRPAPPVRRRGWLARHWRRWLLVPGSLLAALLFAFATGLLPLESPRIDEPLQGPPPGPPPSDSLLSEPDPQPLADDPIPVSGALQVTSTPSPVSVWLDGQRKGRTPLTIPQVAAGLHSVELTHEEYEPYSTTVTVRSNRTELVNAMLTPVEGDLRITSVPDGADVVLDNAPRGTTPCTLRGVRVGRHELTLSKEGYGAYSTSVSVIPRIENAIHADLSLLTSTLRVRVVPSGLIYINEDRKTEDTNATYSTSLLPGAYAITGLSLTYGRWVKRITLDGHSDQEVVFDFTREYRVTVASDPPAAKIYVNDVFTKKYTPSALMLRPGERTIEVRKEGYALQGKPVELTVEGDVEEPIEFGLVPS